MASGSCVGRTEEPSHHRKRDQLRLRLQRAIPDHSEDHYPLLDGFTKYTIFASPL